MVFGYIFFWDFPCSIIWTGWGRGGIILLDFGKHDENWKRIPNKKTRVGFGRTEVSVRLGCIFVCALSFGHGPRNPGFQGFCKRLDFHAFLHGILLDIRNNHENW